MEPQNVALAPTEFEGAPGTCVVGRCVIKRGPISVKRNEDKPEATSANATASSKGKTKKGKGKAAKQAKGKEGEVLKTEVHLLGGKTADEILFVDAWADNARELDSRMTLTKIYRVAGGKYIGRAPEYSTSRLPYFIRLEGRFGSEVHIQEYNEDPWTDIPLHHPFADIANLTRVSDKMQTCLAGVVSYQPGLVDRDTKYGPGQVCNAYIKRNQTTIRCSFWREQGAELATKAAGSVIAVLQVNVIKSNGSWECHATRSTQITECPEPLKGELLQSTDLESTGHSLTRNTSVDYETCSTTSVTLSALASILAPKGSRDLGGVYELHNAGVFGVTAVLSDGSFKIEKSCKECFCRLADGVDACPSHPEAGVAPRWMFSLEIADGEASLSAMLYHDQAKTLPFLTDDLDGSDPMVQQEIVKHFRAEPWSLRLILKPDIVKNSNYLEIKKLLPTITPEGLVGTFAFVNAPRVDAGKPGCPFAFCSDVKFDEDFGVVRYKDVEVTAVRVLLKTEKAVAGDPDVGTPDPTMSGLRVVRRVSCCLNDLDQAAYYLSVSGVCRTVQWLLTAAPGAAFYVTAKAKTFRDTIEFRAMSFKDVSEIGEETFTKFMKSSLSNSKTELVQFTPTRATPASRKRTIDDFTKDESAQLNGPFSKRIAFGDFAH